MLGRFGRGAVEQLEADQDRWFLWVPVLVGTGIALYLTASFEPSWTLTAALLAGAAVLAGLWRGGLAAYLVTSALIATTSGFAAAKVRTWSVAAPVLAVESRSPLTVTGWVEQAEPRAGGGSRVTVRVAEIAGLVRQATPYRVRVRLMSRGQPIRAGSAIKVEAKLTPPPGPVLPGAFDFSRNAWFQALGAVGYARAPPEPVEIGAPMPWDLRVRIPIERLRQTIGARISAALPGETGAIATALITGERGGISEATNTAFRDSGLLHILSISGLHMAIMAGAVFVSLRFLLALWPRLALDYPIKKWAASGAALAALGYLLISGISYPPIRSYLMISIMLLAILLDRPALALRNVALAALGIMLAMPESLVDAGFQMSFAAVTALVSAYEVLHRRQAARAGQREAARSLLATGALFFGGIVASTVIASLAVAPFAAYHFHKSQQYAVLANLIAIPLCNIVVMPAALASLIAMPFGLEAWPLAVMGLGIEGMVLCARTVAALPGAVGRIPEMSTAAFLPIVLGGLWLTLWRSRWRWAGLLPVLAGVVLLPMRDAPDVIVARDGTVAVRGRDGLLSASTQRRGSFDLSRILEHDGDSRAASEVATAKAFRCDWMGCVARVRGHTVSLVTDPAALPDDCVRAAVMILRVPRLGMRDVAARCTGPGAMVDEAALRAEGAHLFWLTPVDGAAKAAPPQAHVADRTSHRLGRDVSPPAASQDAPAAEFRPLSGAPEASFGGGVATSSGATAIRRRATARWHNRPWSNDRQPGTDGPERGAVPARPPQ